MSMLILLRGLMKRFCVIFSSILLIFTFLSCNTIVHFNATVDGEPIEGAKVYIDGQLIGKTPVTAELSNAIWEEPIITIKADGYKTLNSTLRNEVKPAPLVCGVLFFWPIALWCYGPIEVQNYELEPATSQ